MRTLATVLLFAAPLFAQDPTESPARGVNFYSLEKEQALGAQLVAEYRRTIPVIENAPVSAYLDHLGQRLAALLPDPPFHYQFQLVDDDGTLLHAAPNFPGGFVFVPAQLILAAQSESELAGMLSTAIARIAARHQTKQLTKVELGNIASIPLVFMGGWSGNAPRQGELVPAGFRRMELAQELQADSMALDLLSRAGFDPGALFRYLERAGEFPGREARLAALETALAKIPAAPAPPLSDFAAIQAQTGPLVAHPAKAPPRLSK